MSLGLLAVAAGAAIIMVGLGVIPTEETSRNAPPWVIVAAGAVFFVAGGYSVVVGSIDLRRPGYIERMSRGGKFNPAGWLVGAFIASTFFAIAAWVAFGPGERAFSGGVGGGGLGVGGPVGERAGRIVFGISAVILGAVSVWIWAYGLSKLLARPTGPESEPD
ncbi:MAG: hypothetical protein KJO44_02200 [Gemmatimonadetes bacterium]|nr:hypothetical protein [Gemmatimonadota bacterium]MBT8477528.1 hypothetical protein [Gemmatimonadota bacterium]NNK47794.1 hypothetical protein [Gemmatimonadota bacterium]